MEKIKNFVIKYQLWFKLAAIALLICVLFTPYISSGRAEVTGHMSFWDYVYDTSYYVPLIGLQFHWIVSWIVFFISIISIVFVLLSLWKKPYFILFSISYIVDFIFIMAATIFACVYEKFPNEIAMPHVAFYISLILFIITILFLYFWKKDRLKKPTKSEQIAQLEKRIEQLEQERDGK